MSNKIQAQNWYQTHDTFLLKDTQQNNKADSKYTMETKKCVCLNKIAAQKRHINMRN